MADEEDERRKNLLLMQKAWKQMRTIYLSRSPKLDNPRLTNSISPTFPNFASLPIELRNAIWRFALPKPTLVDLNSDRALPPNSPESRRCWFSTIQAPVLLNVCRESRALVLKHYECAFRDENGRGGIWVDFEVDTFSLDAFTRPDGKLCVDDFKGDFEKIRILVLPMDATQDMAGIVITDGDEVIDIRDEDDKVGWWPEKFAMAMSKLEHIILVNLEDGMLFDLLCPNREDKTLNNRENSDENVHHYDMSDEVWLILKYNFKIPFLFSYLIRSPSEWKRNPIITVPDFERRKWPELLEQESGTSSSKRGAIIMVEHDRLQLYHYQALEDSFTPHM